MADVITRFKLETTQYDSKLRDAVKGLKEVVHMNELAGKEFKEFSDKAIEAARALGQQATGATNAKDKVKELVSSYNEMAKTYNLMSDVMKKSEGGKALAASLDQLKQRIKDAKAEMNTTPGILDKLASKFVVSFDAVKMFNVGLQAAEGALKVAKDAFFASEANVDEWARVVASSESVYEGFLTAINNGDISGYLGRIDQIVQAAREAYNELDKLGTMRTIQGPQFSKQEAENTRMRMMIMTGRYIAPAAGSGMKAAMAEGTVLTPEQIRRIEQKLENGMKSIGALTKNELAQTGKAIDAYYNKLAVQNGMSRSEFRQGTSSWDEFSRRMQGYEQYKEWDRQARTEFAKQGGRGYVDFDKSNPYAEYRKWGTFRVDKMGENSYNDLVGLIKQQQQQTNQLYSQMGHTYRTINRAEGITVKGIMNGKGGSGGGGGKGGGHEITYAADSIAAQQALVQQLTKQWNEAGADVRDQYLQPLVEAEAKLKEMQNTMALQKAQAEGKLNGVNLWQGDIDDITGGKTPQFAGSLPDLTKSLQLDNLPQFLSPLQQLNAELEQLRKNLEYAPTTEAYQEGLKAIADKQKEIASFKGIDLAKDADKSAKSFQAAAGAISQVGSALNGIEDPTAKILGIIAQAIASVAAGAGQAVSAKDTTSSGWAWIGAAAAITASMVAMISQIHSATGYAQGGIVDGRGGGFVGGMSYSGDNIGNVRLDSGELVLNRAQQTSLANQLQSSPMSQMQLSAVVTGEQIRLVLNNNGRRTGRGEYVTTNFT